MDPVTATEIFYAWELRGRGWWVCDEPVSLEPPFRPFHWPRVAFTAQDDGRHHTFGSALIAKAKRLFSVRSEAVSSAGSRDEAAATLLGEQPIFAALRRGSLAAFSISVPADYGTRRETMEQLVVSLAQVRAPISFELLGVPGEIVVSLACEKRDALLVKTLVSAFVPEASVEEEPDLLSRSWSSAGPHRVVVDFGLSEEFMLPLATPARFEVDPLISIAAALSAVCEGEVGVLQVLFEPTSHPWVESIGRAISDGASGCFFADAPHMLPLAREKVMSPLFAAAIRVAAGSSSTERSWELARSLGGSLSHLARAESNELIPLDDKNYPPSLHEADFLLRQSRRPGMLLSTSELVSLVHLPHGSVREPKLRRLVTKTRAAPSETSGHALILGVNSHRGENRAVSLATEQRLRHMHIVGASGTGKSTLLLSLVVQAIEAGEGLGVLDPHGDLVDEILARIPQGRVDDVVVFDPADVDHPVPFNVLEAHSELEREILASDLVAVFRRLATSWGDQMTAILGNAIAAFLDHPDGGTLLDLRNFLVDPAYRRTYLAGVADDEVGRFWRETFPKLSGGRETPLLTRLSAFLRPRLIRQIVSRRDKSLDVASIMNEEKIFLAKLSHGLIGEENAYLLGSLLVAKFHQVALARQAAAPSERKPFYLVVDEFQHFATPSMAAVLSGARKYGLGLVLAHQGLGQLASAGELKSAVLGNSYTRVIFRVGDEDARSLASGFSAFDAEDLGSLATGEAVCRVGQARQDFSLSTSPLPWLSPEVARLRRAEIVARSRAQYACAVEAAASDAPASTNGTVSAALPASVLTATEEPPTTDAAFEGDCAPRLSPSSTQTPGRGGVKHKYLQHLIKQLAEERGYRATIEAQLPSELGRVDVSLERDGSRLACEISITTSAEHELGNIEKCLSAGYDGVLLVAVTERHLARVRSAIESRLRPGSQQRVRFVLAADLPTELADTPDALDATAPTVKGYRVRVSRRAVGTEEARAKREAIGRVMANSMQRTETRK